MPVALQHGVTPESSAEMVRNSLQFEGVRPSFRKTYPFLFFAPKMPSSTTTMRARGGLRQGHWETSQPPHVTRVR